MADMPGTRLHKEFEDFSTSRNLVRLRQMAGASFAARCGDWCLTKGAAGLKMAGFHKLPPDIRRCQHEHVRLLDHGC